jgi:hypothetical protein
MIRRTSVGDATPPSRAARRRAAPGTEKWRCAQSRPAKRARFVSRFAHYDLARHDQNFLARHSKILARFNRRQRGRKPPCRRLPPAPCPHLSGRRSRQTRFAGENSRLVIECSPKNIDWVSSTRQTDSGRLHSQRRPAFVHCFSPRARRSPSAPEYPAPLQALSPMDPVAPRITTRLRFTSLNDSSCLCDVDHEAHVEKQ